MKFIWLFALFILFSAEQCAKEIDTAMLINKWGHSHEEDAEGILVYRPHTYNFPMARGREWFEFKPDGSFIQYDIAPTDGNVTVPGTWKQAPGNADALLITLDKEQANSYRMEIVELTKDVLKFKKINNQ